MLGRLNEFLFGSSETDDAAVDRTQASQQVDLDTKEGDMGWELVVVPGKEDGNSRAKAGEGKRRQKRQKSSSSQSQQQASKEVCGSGRDSSHLPSPAAAPSSDSGEVLTEGESQTSDCESQDSGRDLVLWDRGPRLASQLGESWILTPPPCFTGTDSISTQLSSSPLENLLIEHPSMSVYNSLQEQPEEEEDQAEEMEVVRADQGAAMPTRVTRSSVGVAQQIKLTRCHQRKQQVECRKQLTKKNFERSNKARMVQSTCRKQVSTRSRVLRPSGCMNGRRTQRAF